MLTATFNNISVKSWRPVLLVKENGGHGEKHPFAARQWQTFSHNVLSNTPQHEITTSVEIVTECTGRYKSIYHTITIRTALCNWNSFSQIIIWLVDTTFWLDVCTKVKGCQYYYYDILVVVYDRKIYNFFIQALETDNKSTLWRAFLACFCASANTNAIFVTKYLLMYIFLSCNFINLNQPTNFTQNVRSPIRCYRFQWCPLSRPRR